MSNPQQNEHLTTQRAAPFAEMPGEQTGLTDALIVLPKTDTPIRPFQVSIPENELVELKRRVRAARWPDRETAPDQSQGVKLETIQELARYWADDYDWRKVEAKINSYPNFLKKLTVSTFTSFMSRRNIRKPFRFSSPMAGRARSSSN